MVSKVPRLRPTVASAASSRVPCPRCRGLPQGSTSAEGKTDSVQGATDADAGAGDTERCRLH